MLLLAGHWATDDRTQDFIKGMGGQVKLPIFLSVSLGSTPAHLTLFPPEASVTVLS